MTPKILQVNRSLEVPLAEMEFEAIHAQGAGGQNVNKVASAIHLKFNVKNSSLPDRVKEKLYHLRDKRVSKEGVITIKAQQHRTQKQNRANALNRLRKMLEFAMVTRKKRKPTRPTAGSQKKRLDSKAHRGRLKQSRGKVGTE